MGKLKDTRNKSLQLFDDEHPTTAIPTRKDQQNPDEVQQLILQQSVTILAFKDKSFDNGTTVPDALKPKLFLGILSEDLPLFVGAIIGASLIIGICLLIVAIWKCCRMTVLNKKKDYCLEPLEKSGCKNKKIPTIVQSNSVVFLGLKRTTLFEPNQKNYMEEENSGFYSSPKVLKRLQISNRQIVMNEGMPNTELLNTNNCMVEEPKSLLDNIYPESCTNQSSSLLPTMQKSNSSQDISKTNSLSPNSITIPTVIVHHDSPALLHRSFYSGIFDQQSLYSCQSHLGSEIDLKSCTLNWSNYSLRPSSTSDCYYDLFQKASFCKKRKNRMRSDIAAAIALNRSQSSHLNQDTDSLVENEVEIISNERTTL